MNKYIRKSILLAVLVIMAASYTSCSGADELVPVSKDETSTNSFYKMPDPSVLTAIDNKELEDMKKEYSDNVKE